VKIEQILSEKCDVAEIGSDVSVRAGLAVCSTWQAIVQRTGDDLLQADEYLVRGRQSGSSAPTE